MLRMFVATLSVLALTAGSLTAEEIRCRVKSVDATKNTVTVMVGSKEQTFECAKDCRVMGSSGSLLPRRGGQMVELSGGLSNLREGVSCTLVTEARGGAQMVTQIQTDLTVRMRPRLFNR